MTRRQNDDEEVDFSQYRRAYMGERGERGADGGAATWVRWVISSLMVVVVGLGSAIVKDHTALAVLESQQTDASKHAAEMVQRQIDSNDRIARSLQVMVAQHQDSLVKMQQIIDIFSPVRMRDDGHSRR